MTWLEFYKNLFAVTQAENGKVNSAVVSTAIINALPAIDENTFADAAKTLEVAYSLAPNNLDQAHFDALFNKIFSATLQLMKASKVGLVEDAKKVLAITKKIAEKNTAHQAKLDQLFAAIYQVVVKQLLAVAKDILKDDEQPIDIQANNLNPTKETLAKMMRHTVEIFDDVLKNPKPIVEQMWASVRIFDLTNSLKSGAEKLEIVKTMRAYEAYLDKHADQVAPDAAVVLKAFIEGVTFYSGYVKELILPAIMPVLDVLPWPANGAAKKGLPAFFNSPSSSIIQDEINRVNNKLKGILKKIEHPVLAAAPGAIPAAPAPQAPIAVEAKPVALDFELENVRKLVKAYEKSQQQYTDSLPSAFGLASRLNSLREEIDILLIELQTSVNGFLADDQLTSIEPQTWNNMATKHNAIREMIALVYSSEVEDLLVSQKLVTREEFNSQKGSAISTREKLYAGLQQVNKLPRTKSLQSQPELKKEDCFSISAADLQQEIAPIKQEDVSLKAAKSNLDEAKKRLAVYVAPENNEFQTTAEKFKAEFSTQINQYLTERDQKYKVYDFFQGLFSKTTKSDHYLRHEFLEDELQPALDAYFTSFSQEDKKTVIDLIEANRDKFKARTYDPKKPDYKKTMHYLLTDIENKLNLLNAQGSNSTSSSNSKTNIRFHYYKIH